MSAGCHSCHNFSGNSLILWTHFDMIWMSEWIFGTQTWICHVTERHPYNPENWLTIWTACYETQQPLALDFPFIIVELFYLPDSVAGPEAEVSNGKGKHLNKCSGDCFTCFVSNILFLFFLSHILTDERAFKFCCEKCKAVQQVGRETKRLSFLYILNCISHSSDAVDDIVLVFYGFSKRF